MRTQFVGRITAIVILGLASSAALAQLTTRALLSEMTALRQLAEYPEPEFTCRQFSSYDRAAKSPDEDWFANGDRGQYLRTEEVDGRTEYVMMDAAGPGAIVRIWSANPMGTLRFYFDNESTPRLVVPMEELLGGTFDGIPAPIAGERSRGWNCYFPFLYAKHCKLTCDNGDFYYHVNYRTYPSFTPVESFTPVVLEQLAGEITEVARRLELARDQGISPQPGDESREAKPVPVVLPQFDAKTKVLAATYTIEPGTTWQEDIAKRQGPGAIVGLRCQVRADELDQALRGLLLKLTFDDETTVICPLGDFFGAAPGINPYGSLPLGVTRDGELWSHWVMPYRRRASLEIVNHTNAPATVALTVATAPQRWNNRSMHFSAQWREARNVPTRPMIDWNYVTIEGQGVFVGASFSIANPDRAWWGEGDEKIYVDGETFPSHFGTGTEDYYGYAWCSNQTFSHAYHNQPRCDGPNNYGQTSVNRWHILDQIPFTKQFKFDMELWHWAETINVTQMSVVTYWYARPGATSQREPIDDEKLVLLKTPPYTPQRVEGALEGEELEIVTKTAGKTENQMIMNCSNDQQLWWYGAAPEDRLVVQFPVPEAGKYQVLIRRLLARDYGIVQLSVNGQPAGEPIDSYSANLRVADELSLGEFELSAGDNQLEVKIVGAHPDALKRYMFGLDYVRLVKIP